jgi:hypothetical protein
MICRIGQCATKDFEGADAMQPAINSLLGQYNIDRHLIAAVQKNSGAHCHQSANLLYSYYLRVELYQQALNHNDHQEGQQALNGLQDSERDLRKFLFRCRRPSYA